MSGFFIKIPASLFLLLNKYLLMMKDTFQKLLKRCLIVEEKSPELN